MKDPDISRIRDYIRPSFRGLTFSGGFCLIIGLIMLIIGGEDGPEAALIAMLASAAVLAIPAWMEWSPYFRALSELRSLRDDPAMHQAVLKDFDTAPSAFQGDARIGSLCLFGRGSGALIKRGVGCRVIYGKFYFKGGWGWRISVKNGSSFPEKLLDLRRDQYSEDAIKACVDQANAMLEA